MPQRAPDYEIKMVAAARMAATGQEQKSIATQLGLSPSVISRMLDEAAERNWLCRTPRLDAQAIPEDLKEQADSLLRRREQEQRLMRLFTKTSLRAAFVVDSGGVGGDSTELARRLDRFGRTVAPQVAEFISQHEFIGVSWGGTLRSIVHGLGVLGQRWDTRSRPRHFIPLCAEPLGYSDVSSSASTPLSVAASASSLAHELNRIVNGGEGRSYSLTGVPANIPHDFTPAECEAIEKLMLRVPSYREIYPPRFRPLDDAHVPPCLIDEISLVFTSVGPRERTLNWQGDRLVKEADISRSKLSKAVIGDIGGILIPQPKLAKGAQQLVTHWNNSWTGVRRDELQRIAERGAVAVVAIGKSKVDIVVEVIKLGLCQILLCDEDLASSVLRQKQP